MSIKKIEIIMSIPDNADHPSEWDWPVLLDVSPDEIERIEVYDAGSLA